MNPAWRFMFGLIAEAGIKVLRVASLLTFAVGPIKSASRPLKLRLVMLA
jgi:hypothetical protein